MLRSCKGCKVIALDIGVGAQVQGTAGYCTLAFSALRATRNLHLPVRLLRLDEFSAAKKEAFQTWFQSANLAVKVR